MPCVKTLSVLSVGILVFWMSVTAWLIGLMSLEVVMMKRICWNRIAAFLMALAVVLVAVLPGFVVPVSAASNPYVSVSDYFINEIYYPAGTGAYMSTAHYDRSYKIDSISSRWYFGIGQYGKNDSTDDSFTVVPSELNFTSIFSPSPRVDGNSAYFYIGDLAADKMHFEYGISIDWSVSDIIFSYRPRYWFYDENFSLVYAADTSTESFKSLPGYSQRFYYSQTVDIPDGAAYFYTELTVSWAAEVFPEGNTDSVTFNMEEYTMHICATEFGDIEPTEPTDPTEDPGSSGGSDSGSGSSGGSVSFDDSGIIDSVTSSADKIITEIGADIDNQTQQFANYIAAQNGLLQQGFDDLYTISDDIYNNIDITNDKLDSTNENLETMIGDGTEGDELQAGSDSISNDTDSVSDFEKEQQSVLDDNFEIIQNEINFSTYINALAFVQEILNMTFLNMGDIRIIYSFPLFLGMFFFLCSRAPGAVRPAKVYHKDHVVSKKMG